MTRRTPYSEPLYTWQSCVYASLWVRFSDWHLRCVKNENRYRNSCCVNKGELESSFGLRFFPLGDAPAAEGASSGLGDVRGAMRGKDGLVGPLKGFRDVQKEEQGCVLDQGSCCYGQPLYSRHKLCHVSWTDDILKMAKANVLQVIPEYLVSFLPALIYHNSRERWRRCKTMKSLKSASPL